jgi:hypothetical protein
MPHCRLVKTSTLNMLIKRCDIALMVKDSRSAERTGEKKGKNELNVEDMIAVA